MKTSRTIITAIAAGATALALAACASSGSTAPKPSATASHAPVKAASPAVLTPDQVLIRDGYTPTYLLEPSEVISQAVTPAISEMLQTAISGNSSVGFNGGGYGNTMQVVVPVSKAGRLALDTPGALNEIDTGTGSGTTAKFDGPYLVITGPANQPGPSASAS